MKEILEILRLRAALPNKPYALATVVKVEGSSYRKPGARMLIGANGRLAGSVSGGCLERDVISRGLTVLLSGQRQLAIYDTTDQDDLAFGSSLGCAGRIEILIEPVPASQPFPLADIVQRILAAHEAGAVATVYRAEGGQSALVGQTAFVVGSEGLQAFDPHLLTVPSLQEDLRHVAETRKPQNITHEAENGRLEILLERIAPPLPLILFGGGHDAVPLVRLAREVGHQVTVVDRRADFADPLRFPGAEQVLHIPPHLVTAQLKPAPDAAVVIMNHHYETDAELLGILLRTEVAYLGMLGPRRRTDKILRELRDGGLLITESEMKKLHAPAGLDLGSENPEQIALSILAEIQAVMSGRNAGNLRGQATAQTQPEKKPPLWQRSASSF